MPPKKQKAPASAKQKIHLSRETVQEPYVEEEEDEYEEEEYDNKWDRRGEIMMKCGQFLFAGALVFAGIARMVVKGSGRAGSGLTPEALMVLIPFWSVLLISFLLMGFGYVLQDD